MALAVSKLVNTVRRFRIILALQDCNHTLAHVAANRLNDDLVERHTHKRQANLIAELHRLESAK